MATPDWSRKSDAWLISALRSEHPEEQNRAIEELQRQYQPQLERYVRGVLPEDWVEDVIQEIWVALYCGVQNREIGDMGGYLGGIARNKRADAVERLTLERSVEADQPVPRHLESTEELEFEDKGGSIDEQIQRAEELLVLELGLDFVALAPFADRVLSDCQRVIWSMRKLHRYPSKAVGKLLGKTDDTINSHFYRARKQLLEFCKSGEFQEILTTRELPPSLQFTPQREANAVVERFAEAVICQFTADELKALGLTRKEFRENYVASVMMPRWYNTVDVLETSPPSLLLTRKVDWEELRDLLQKLRKNPDNQDFLFPEECIVNFSVEENYIVLEPQPLVELIPNLDPPKFADKTYLSVHEPRMIIPATWGFWDESLYTPEVLARWPFLQYGGWHDVRG